MLLRKSDGQKMLTKSASVPCECVASESSFMEEWLYCAACGCFCIGVARTILKPQICTMAEFNFTAGMWCCECGASFNPVISPELRLPEKAHPLRPRMIPSGSHVKQ